MSARIALFELRYQLRRPIALVSFLVFALLALGIVAAFGRNPQVTVPVNAPWWILFTFSLLSVLAMFLSLATFADVALRDGDTRMDAVLRAQPVRTSIHFGARFAGACAVACLAFLGAAVGHMLGGLLPGVLPDSIGPFRPEGYVLAAALIVLPTLFATGALFFTVATFTRSLMATYLSGVALVILIVETQFLLKSPAHTTLAALLEPFGIYALILDTLRWTIAERGSSLIPLDGLLMWNRLLWIGTGGLMLGLSLALFNTRERRPRAPRVELAPAGALPVMRERPVIAAGAAGAWDQLVLRTRHEARAILRSWSFLIMLVLGLLLAVGVLLALTLGGTMVPVTHAVVDVIAGTFMLLTVLMPIAYSGELIWRDRKAKIAEIVDATPAANVVFFLSKIIAVALVILALLSVAMTTGIVFQLANGVTDIAISFYLIKLMLLVGLPALMYTVLAILIQTVLNQKFVSLLLMLTFLGFLSVAPELGIDNKLLLPFTIPDVPLNEINLSYFIAQALWFAGYWSCVSVLIAVVAYLLWIRGAGSLWIRLRRAHLAITPAVALIAVVALAGAAATGGYIHWKSGSMDSSASASEGGRRTSSV